MLRNQVLQIAKATASSLLYGNKANEKLKRDKRENKGGSRILGSERR